jgi:hypothetical protein
MLLRRSFLYSLPEENAEVSHFLNEVLLVVELLPGVNLVELPDVPADVSLLLNEVLLEVELLPGIELVELPDVPADVGLLLGEVLPAEQVVELVHGQPHDLLDRECDPRLSS